MKRHPLSNLVVSLLCVMPCGAAPDATVRLDPERAGRAVSPLFAGLSMETEVVSRHSPANKGSLYFSAANKDLVAAFRQIGVKHLRLGGNTVDDKTKAPSLEDIDELFAFARAAGVKVTYSLRLKDGNPAESAAVARHIFPKYGDICTGLTIGNEPSHYLKTLPEYLGQLLPHVRAVKEAAPSARVNGPSIHRGESDWMEAFRREVGAILPLDYLSGHAYPFGSSYDYVLRKKPEGAGNRGHDIADQLLDDSGGREGEFNGVIERDTVEMRRLMLEYRFPVPAAVPPGQKKGIPYEFVESGFHYAVSKGIAFRMDEINSSYMGGTKDAGNSMAGALWALTYMYSLAEHGAQGLNFHTGTTLPFRKGVLPLNATRKPCYYAALWQLPEGEGFEVKAVGYAMKVFSLAAPGGTLFPVEVAPSSGSRLLAYGVRSGGGELFVTLLNREVDGAARNVRFEMPKGFSKAATMSLVAREHSAASTSGFLLGGSGVDQKGDWKGSWQDMPGDSSVSVSVPPCSVLVLRLGK